MSDQPTPTAPAQPAAPIPTAPAEPVATAPTDAPPWGDPANFDAEKAWKLIQNKQSDIEKLKSRPALTDEQKQKLAEFDRLEAANKTELERAQEAAQKNAERAQAYLNSAVTAKIEALATGFADPSDAVSSLDAKSFTNESGEIDSAAIKDALADLLTRKPHWAKAPETRTPAPNPAQGSSGSGPSGTPQVTREQMASMTPAEIDKAYAEGRMSHVLGSK